MMFSVSHWREFSNEVLEAYLLRRASWDEAQWEFRCRLSDRPMKADQERQDPACRGVAETCGIVAEGPHQNKACTRYTVE